MDKQTWPAWYNGPNGEAQIFNSADEVPKGWTTGAEKTAVEGGKAPTPTPTPTPGADQTGKGELDAHGHPWSADKHSATKSKTQAGLWRMRVGVSRPDPLPGYPKPLDL